MLKPEPWECMQAAACKAASTQITAIIVMPMAACKAASTKITAIIVMLMAASIKTAAAQAAPHAAHEPPKLRRSTRRFRKARRRSKANPTYGGEPTAPATTGAATLPHSAN